MGEPEGYILAGFYVIFNWSEYSDIDLHIVVDFKKVDKRVEFVEDILNLKECME